MTTTFKFKTLEDAIAANAKGTDLVVESCGWCSGTGNIGYGNVRSTHYKLGAAIGSCFVCIGTGVVTVQVRSIKARQRREAKRAEEQAKLIAQTELDKAARLSWNAANPEIAALIDELADHKREQGLAFELWNSPTTIPTSAQIETLLKIKADRDRRESERRPVQTGTQIFTGQIISIKNHESHYGYSRQITTKMVVRDDRGFKVWGTMPQALIDAVYDAWLGSLADPEHRGDFGPEVWRQWAKDQGVRVTFTETVEPAEGDDSFDVGFYTRPRKVALACRQGEGRGS